VEVRQDPVDLVGQPLGAQLRRNVVAHVADQGLGRGFQGLRVDGLEERIDGLGAALEAATV
jgi:hypothetical protein